MKKLLSLFLCAALALSLAVPALAAEAETAVPISAPISADDYIAAQLVRDTTRIETFRTENPGVLEAIEAEGLETWFLSEYYYYYASLEEYMEDYGQTLEQTELEMRLLWIEEYERTQKHQAAVDAVKLSMGGVAGNAPAVMFDGRYVSFSGAQPVILDGTLYAPADVLCRAFGASALPDGVQTLTQDGVTLCAVRQLGSALGYEVFWDRQFNTAVVVDRLGLIADYEDDFSLFNKLLSPYTLLGDYTSLTGSSKINADVTLFNSIDGDRAYAFHGDVSFAQSERAVTTEVRMDASALSDLLEDSGLLTAMKETMDAEEALMLQMALALLSDLRFSMNMDLDAGAMYFQAPFLSLLLPEVDANTWIKMELPSGSYELLMSNLSAASLICLLAESGYSEYYYSSYYYSSPVSETTPVFLYRGVTQTLDTCLTLFGDDAFQRKGGANVLTLDGDAIAKLLVDPDAYYPAFLGFKEFSCVLTLQDDGSYSLAFHIRPDFSILSLSIIDFLFSGSIVQKNTSATTDLEYHLKNVFKAVITEKTTWTRSNDPINAAPPEDATILDMGSFYY